MPTHQSPVERLRDECRGVAAWDVQSCPGGFTARFRPGHHWVGARYRTPGRPGAAAEYDPGFAPGWLRVTDRERPEPVFECAGFTGVPGGRDAPEVFTGSRRQVTPVETALLEAAATPGLTADLQWVSNCLRVVTVRAGLAGLTDQFPGLLVDHYEGGWWVDGTLHGTPFVVEATGGVVALSLIPSPRRPTWAPWAARERLDGAEPDQFTVAQFIGFMPRLIRGLAWIEPTFTPSVPG